MMLEGKRAQSRHGDARVPEKTGGCQATAALKTKFDPTC